MRTILAIPLLLLSLVLMIVMLPFVGVAIVASIVSGVAQFIVNMLTDTVDVFNDYIQGE